MASGKNTSNSAHSHKQTNSGSSIKNTGFGSISKGSSAFGTVKGRAVLPITITGDADHGVEMREVIAASEEQAQASRRRSSSSSSEEGQGQNSLQVPLEEDLLKLVILGEEKLVTELLESGKASASCRDANKVTALHVGLTFPHTLRAAAWGRRRKKT